MSWDDIWFIAYLLIGIWVFWCVIQWVIYRITYLITKAIDDAKQKDANNTYF